VTETDNQHIKTNIKTSKTVAQVTTQQHRLRDPEPA